MPEFGFKFHFKQANEKSQLQLPPCAENIHLLRFSQNLSQKSNRNLYQIRFGVKLGSLNHQTVS